MKRKSRILSAIVLVVSIVLSNMFFTQAATVTKNAKSYEIAVVFDNSGSMYDNQAWCRAKYAMEIFSSMLHYESGDILKIFPMWPVTTDGSTPESGGSYDGIEIRSDTDINKISNLYTVSPSNTPFAPITEAYDELRNSKAKEKWLIVLTDGKFNEEARGQYAKIDLQNRLLDLSSQSIKVQYLGIGEAEMLASDESKFFYAKKSSDVSLKDDLISVCNTIFQRSVLPAKYISGSTLKLDMSMSSLIVFAQGADAKIVGLKSETGNNVGINLDSGQRRYSTISAGGKYSSAPIDSTLAGQVVTFGACPKGSYELSCSGADAIEIFYEPNVDIKMTLINDDGQEMDYSQGSIPAGEYTVNYGLVDAETGEDVTSSELMGNGIKWDKSVIKPSDTSKGEIPFENGGKIVLEPDDATKIIIEGTYLKDYVISTEDDPRFCNGFEIQLPGLHDLSMTLSTDQSSSWYQIGKEEKWKPIRVDLTLEGVPLTDEQLAKVKLDLNFSKDIEYSSRQLTGESAYEILIGQGESGYKKPDSGKYKLVATATLADEFGQEVSATDSIKFEVQTYSAMWRWLKWIIILLALLLLIIFILSRKAWPKEMFFNCIEGPKKGSSKINVGKNMNIVSNAYPNTLTCTVEKASTLRKKFGRGAAIKIVKVDPAFNVKSFKIGSSGTYTKDGGKYLDSKGKEFKETFVRQNTKVEVEFTQKNKSAVVGKVCMNSKK